MGIMTRNTVKGSQRSFSKGALLVTIVSLWALWAYAYSTLRSLENEVEALPKYYGMYLYRESVRDRLEEAARQVGLMNDQEDWRDLGMFLGPEEALVLVERQGLRILHPTEPPYGSADFLGEAEARTAFLRTLERMEEQGSRGGYLSIDTPGTLGGWNKKRWFLLVAPAGEDLLCILPVPEERGRRTGDILAGAQGNLLREKRRRFVLWTLPVVVLSSLFIGILYRRQTKSDRGRGM
jgi:hypothetical protein